MFWEKVEQLKKKMKELTLEECDCESTHVWADNILCDILIELGHEDVVGDFRSIEKWYS